MALSTCPHCKTGVVPTADGICPSCRHVFAGPSSEMRPDADMRESARESSNPYSSPESASRESGIADRMDRDDASPLLRLARYAARAPMVWIPIVVLMTFLGPVHRRLEFDLIPIILGSLFLVTTFVGFGIGCTALLVGAYRCLGKLALTGALAVFLNAVAFAIPIVVRMIRLSVIAAR